MALGEGYLPPVVATVEATAADLVRVLTQAKALLGDFSSTPTTKRITGDAKELEADLAAARAAGDAAAAKPITFRVRVDLAEALAQLESFKTYASVSTARAVAGWNAAKAAAALTSGTEGGGFIPGAAAGGAAGGRGGGPGFWAGLMSGWGRNFGQGNLWQNTLGFGPGAGFLGMAGMGSIGAMAGLGFEHLLMTGIGLGGSLVGGGLGAGMLGLGGLGVMGVGTGSDLAVGMETRQATKALKQGILTSSDATQQQKALAALEAGTLSLAQATTLYGAAAAKAQYNVAQLTTTVDIQWLHAIGAAQVQQSALMTQVLHLAQTYVPLVAGAAAQNLAIVNTSLQPLFAWLEGPMGIGIFQDLERQFKANLPYAIDAFTQGVELLLRTMDEASQYTGGFVRHIDALLTSLNSPDGFNKVQRFVSDTVYYFRLWEQIVKDLGRDIYLLFTHDAGTAQSILVWLDQMLVRLGTWESSVQGGAQLHTIFQVHKDQVLALLNLLVPLVSGLGHVYMTVAPALTTALTTVLKAVTPVLDAMVKTPWGAWAVGIGLLASKFGLLGAALGPVAASIASIAANWAKVGWNAIAGALGWRQIGGTGTKGSAAEVMQTAASTQLEAANIQLDAATRNAAGGLGGAVTGGAAGESVGAVEGGAAAAGLSLAKVIGRILPGILGGALGDLLGGQIGQGIGGTTGGHIGGIIGGTLGGGLLGLQLGGPWGAVIGAGVAAIGSTLKEFWPQITGALSVAFGNIAHFFRDLPSHMAGFFAAIPGAVASFFGAVGGWFRALPGRIGGFFSTVGSALGSFFGSVGHFFGSIDPYKLGQAVGAGVRTFFGAITSFFGSLLGRLGGLLGTVFSTVGGWLLGLGGYFLSLPGRLVGLLGNLASGAIGFLRGLVGFFVGLPGRIVTFLIGLPGAIFGFFRGLISFFVDLPGRIAGVVGSVFGAVKSAISGLAGAIGNAIAGIARGVSGFFSGLLNGLGLSGLFSSIGSDLFGGLHLPPHAPPNAAGGTISPGTWGTVGERAMELAYAMPGGGVRIYPLGDRGNGTGLAGGGGMVVQVSAPVQMSFASAPANPQQLVSVVDRAVEQSWAKVIQHMGGGARMALGIG